MKHPRDKKPKRDRMPHPPSASHKGRPRILWNSSSIPAMKRVAAIPNANIEATMPSKCTNPSTCGPMMIPNMTSRTTAGTRNTTGSSASNGPATATNRTSKPKNEFRQTYLRTQTVVHRASGSHDGTSCSFGAVVLVGAPAAIASNVLRQHGHQSPIHARAAKKAPKSMFCCVTRPQRWAIRLEECPSKLKLGKCW